MSVTKLLDVRSKLIENKEGKKTLVGFDGFVDEIFHVVNKRIDKHNYERLDKMQDFAKRIHDAAGLSTNMEYVSQQVKLGGNGPIMGNALLAQDHEVSYLGTIGEKDIHYIFDEFAEKCKEVYSISEPGFTDAVEFHDGKLLFGKLKTLGEMNWKAIKEKVGLEIINRLCNEVDFVAFTNWTMLTELNSVMIGFNEIFAKLKKRMKVFIDLADPKKRSEEDIKSVLEILKEMQKNADVVLGLNENESKIISTIYSISEDNIENRAVKIKENTALHMIVIHPIQGAAVAWDKGSSWFDGPYTDSPKLTTGAGDNFNAGFCSGWLRGLKPDECLVTGVSTSGFYVRNCHSPSFDELTNFMQLWSQKFGTNF